MYFPPSTTFLFTLFFLSFFFSFFLLLHPIFPQPATFLLSLPYILCSFLLFKDISLLHTSFFLSFFGLNASLSSLLFSLFLYSLFTFFLYLFHCKASDFSQLFSSSLFHLLKFVFLSLFSYFNLYFIFSFFSCFFYFFLLSLSVFGVFSSSLLLFPQRFGRHVLRPSSVVCRTREPSRNFEQGPLLKPRESHVLSPLAITGNKC